MSTEGYTGGEDFDDWDDVSTAPPPPVPANTVVRTKIVSVDPPNKSQAGNPMSKIQLVCEDTALNGDDLSGFARHIYREFVLFTDGMRWKVKQLAFACGLSKEDLPGSSRFEDTSVFAGDLLGKEPIILTKHEKGSDGRPQLRVGRFLTVEEAEKVLNGESLERES